MPSVYIRPQTLLIQCALQYDTLYIPIRGRSSVWKQDLVRIKVAAIVPIVSYIKKYSKTE